jgi:hypothetical protein
VSYVGLTSGIRGVRDLGYVYVDDGMKTFRLNARVFDQLVAGQADEAALRLASRYPSLFVLYHDDETARSSLHAITNA